METILGIDLGTTNSVVSIIRDGKAVVLNDDLGQAILPSAVGFDQEGRLLVGEAARNQAILAPDRTVMSIKRRMGEDTRVTLVGQSYTPQEISAIILRTLKERAEKHLRHPISKAVITVPAFFNENQRAATREAGELAGLEVVRIINEPTAASLTYEANQGRHERLLVYDLGGGTFDVSIVQVEQGVIEVLASHGDTHLGGDDFDKLLLDHVCEKFKSEHSIDLRNSPTSRSRMLQAVEKAKKELSYEAFVTIREAFIAEKQGKPLNLEMTIDRDDYEELITPLLNKTVSSVDTALADAKIHAKDIDKVILVGGSSRTPMVQRLLREQLGKEPHWEVDPDLCVAMGAAIQGGLIAGVDVGPVLVDITPRTLGIRCLGALYGFSSNRLFSPIISRNTALPASRSNIYYTHEEGQSAARIDVYQGENEDVDLNDQIGSFVLDGLDREAAAQSEILVRFDLNLDGTLRVTAVERATAHEKQLTIDNAITRFRAKNKAEAKARLSSVFADAFAPQEHAETQPEIPDEIALRLQDGEKLIAKALKMAENANEDDAAEIDSLIESLREAVRDHSMERLDQAKAKLEDMLFYMEGV
jgi:molecular chaperone DnaK